MPRECIQAAKPGGKFVAERSGLFACAEPGVDRRAVPVKDEEQRPVPAAARMWDVIY